MTLELRPVTEGDTTFLAGLAAARFAHLPLPELAELQDRAQRRQYVERWGPDGEHLVLLDGVPVGRVWWADDAGGCEIIDVALLPDAQGRGLGTAVVAELVAGAGGAAVHLTVDRSKSGWQRSLERLGFVETGGDEVDVRLTRPADGAGATQPSAS